jgi:paraquat-inducible protein B
VLDEARFGDARVRLQTVLAIQPARLGLEGEAGRDAVLATLDARVAEGLRARLASGSLLGGLKVQLVEVAGGDPEAAIDRSTLPFFSLPVTVSDVTDVAGAAAGTLSRLNDLPIEQLLDSAVGFLDNASLLVGSPETQGVPEAVGALIADVRGLIGSPEAQALPGQVAGTLGTIDAAAVEARDLLASVEEARAVERVLAAVDRAGQAADRIGVATEGVPALVERLSAVAARTEGLPLDALVAELTGLATDGRSLIASPDLRAVPGQVGALAAEGQAAVAEARALLGEIDAAGLSARLDARWPPLSGPRPPSTRPPTACPRSSRASTRSRPAPRPCPSTRSWPRSRASPPRPKASWARRPRRPSPPTYPRLCSRPRRSCARPARAASSPTPTRPSPPPARPPTRSRTSSRARASSSTRRG